VWQHLLFLINAFLNDCPYPVVYRIEVWSVGRPHVWCEFRSHSSSVLWKVKITSSLTDFVAATVWAARHHSNSPVHHLLSPMAAWKPHQWTSAWRHQLKPKRRNMFVRNQRGLSMSWNSIRLKYGQQPVELHWSIDRSVRRLFYCVSQSQKQSLWTFAMMCFSIICNCHDF